MLDLIAYYALVGIANQLPDTKILIYETYEIEMPYMSYNIISGILQPVNYIFLKHIVALRV